MNNEIDFNKIILDYITQNTDRFLEIGKSVYLKTSNKLKLKIGKSHQKYLSYVANRYSKAKSFFNRQPTYLYSFYVPLSCSFKRVVDCGQFGLKEIAPSVKFLVIIGGAGVGKSLIMRHLALETITYKFKVPIFIELRSLNQTNYTLFEFIKMTLKKNHFVEDDDYIIKAFESGHFMVFLDGFDEVSISKRDEIAKQIENLSQTYDKNRIIVSSRPDHIFSGWNEFHIYEVNPLGLKEACQLIDKLDFDNSLKKKFLDDLKYGLFDEHYSFLSNPLLLSIMLLTYSLSGDIPGKLSIFYNQAYDALFQRHDAFKGGYQRERLCKLNINDFAKVFSTFSLQTYDKAIIQLTESEALHYIDVSKKLLSLDFDVNDFLRDALQSVSLLIEDGLFITFVHRSFQEYFTAYFISNSEPKIQKALIKKFFTVNRIVSDNIFSLLHEMKSDLVEKIFIIPFLERVEKFIGYNEKLEKENYIKLLQSEILAITLSEGLLSSVHYSDNKATSYFIIIPHILDACGEVINFKPEMVKLFSTKILKYNKASKSNYLPIKALLNEKELFKEFSMGVHVYSFLILEFAMKIKNALIEKHQNAERSLKQILEIS